jgi:hypothetical protein
MRGLPPVKKKKTLLLFGTFILRAFRAPAFSSFGAAGHLNAFPVDQCIGDLAPGFMQVAPRSFARDPEFFCCLFLFEPFEIDKPDQLDLIGL